MDNSLNVILNLILDNISRISILSWSNSLGEHKAFFPNWSSKTEHKTTKKFNFVDLSHEIPWKI